MFSFFSALTILITILLSLLLTPSFVMVWRFKRRVTNFKLLLYHFYRANHKHSRRWRRIINTVNKLLKFQCLNNGFHFLEFKSNRLKNEDSLNMELVTMVTFTTYGKAMNYWQRNYYLLLLFEIHGGLFKTFI